jgi:hypothetical protein
VQAPLRFIKKNNGPKRSIGHFTMSWDQALHDQVGGTYCRNDGSGTNCTAVGYMRHLGRKFSPVSNPSVNRGLPVTANPDVVGPIGGFGWLLTLNSGAPRTLILEQMEIDPSSILMLSIPYPPGTTFTITANTPWWCWVDSDYSCQATFTAVNSMELLRSSLNSTYYVDPSGVLTLRIIQFPGIFTGNPNWFIPTYASPGRNGEGYAIARFERDGVLLPQSSYGTYYNISANCGGTGAYCNGTVPSYDPDVCQSGYVQSAYDSCCLVSDMKKCLYSDGSRNF